MKKLSILLVAIMAIVFVLPSCNSDEEILGPPTIDFKGGDDYVSADATIATGTLFKVGIAAASNAESNKKLVSVRLTRTMDNVTFTDTTISINETLFNADFTFNAQSDGQVEVIKFLLIDDAGKEAANSLTITYESTGIAVEKNAGVLMGSYNDDNGSFYSTVNKLVYSVGDASNNQADIDFAFYLGTQNGSSFGAPADGDVQSVYPAVAHWSINNETLFATTDITAEEFDAIGDTYAFPEFSSDLSGVTQLEDGDVIMFVTVGEKAGLIKVNQINGRGDQVNIDVIVAE